MEQFNRFYLWGTETKYRMGVYTAAVVFFKGIANALMGEFSVDSLIMLEMVFASFAFACIETALFPMGKGWPDGDSGRRTVLWAVLANVIYIGCSLLLGWFPGVPLWGAALLIAMLELGLAAMWYALWLTARRDTRQLNEKLREYQENQG